MMELFRGYVLTKDKRSLEKFKDVDKLKSYEEVKTAPEFAGILGKDTILIDIDNWEESEILMTIVEDLQLNCRVYQTTRGRHFLFKNDGIDSCCTGTPLACGLTADIKVGCKNSYSILKYNNQERFIEWDIEPGSDYDTIPKWLFPVKSSVNLVGLGSGDGRNNILFGYILLLSSAKFSKKDIIFTLNIINKYIFKEPLSEYEMSTITREESFPKEVKSDSKGGDASGFYDGKTFLHHNFAEFLKENDHIRRINGRLYVYKDGIYVDGNRHIEQMMVKHIPTLKSAQRIEVLKYLDIVCPENEQTADANLIAFNNGILDITSGELKEFSPDIIITNKIPWDYVPGAYSEIADKTFNKLACQDKDIRALLEECIGYCFYRRNELSKAFILTGDKSNGKSTFLDMVKDLLGQNNYSALDLEELDERFSVATMAGMLANIGDDISDDFLQGRAVANFKKIVSGNQVKAEIKNDPNIFFMKPVVKLLFSANDIPRMKDKTGAVLRRLVIIPFNARFSPDDADFDPYITYKLKDQKVMEYVINLGIEGLKRILKNSAFTKSEGVEKELKDYEISNNPVLLFFSDLDKSEVENQPTSDIFKLYYGFCMSNGFSPMSNAEFSKQIKKYYNLDIARRSINGQKFRIFITNKDAKITQ